MQHLHELQAPCELVILGTPSGPMQHLHELQATCELATFGTRSGPMQHLHELQAPCELAIFGSRSGPMQHLHELQTTCELANLNWQLVTLATLKRAPNALHVCSLNCSWLFSIVREVSRAHATRKVGCAIESRCMRRPRTPALPEKLGVAMRGTQHTRPHPPPAELFSR